MYCCMECTPGDHEQRPAGGNEMPRSSVAARRRAFARRARSGAALGRAPTRGGRTQLQPRGRHRIRRAQGPEARPAARRGHGRFHIRHPARCGRWGIRAARKTIKRLGARNLKLSAFTSASCRTQARSSALRSAIVRELLAQGVGRAVHDAHVHARQVLAEDPKREQLGTREDGDHRG
jgi:hypothetical protein